MTMKGIGSENGYTGKFCFGFVAPLAIIWVIHILIAWYHTSSKDAGMPISGIWHCCDVRAVLISTSGTALTSEQ